MRFTLEIDCDNEAFEVFGDGGWRVSTRREIERIAGSAAARIEDGESAGNCRDSNGNTVGKWALLESS